MSLLLIVFCLLKSSYTKIVVLWRQKVVRDQGLVDHLRNIMLSQGPAQELPDQGPSSSRQVPPPPPPPEQDPKKSLTPSQLSQMSQLSQQYAIWEKARVE